MREDSTTDSPKSAPREEFSACHHDEFYKSNPEWEDVPELTEETYQEIRETVIEVIPGIIDNAARQRCAIITTVGCQYVRYRRAGCTETQSRREAIKRANCKHDVGDSAVYEHIRALPIEELAEITPYLEQIYTRHHCNLPKAVRAFKEPCDKLIRVLSTIAAISETPSINPPEITLQDVYRDRPDERSRVLTADHNVIGLPRSDGNDRGASVHNVEMALRQQDLKEISGENPIHLTEDARIKTRDIATYDTEYSQILRKIFEAVQAEMVLRGKQKSGPTIGKLGNDNAAVRAVIPYPESIDSPGDVFARLEVQYWERGSSHVQATTHPLGITHDEKDPSLSGPIGAISKRGIHTLVGKTINIAEQTETLNNVSSS